MPPTTDFSGKVILQPDGQHNPRTLAGKSVIITGATSGLGEAFMRNALVKELGADKVAFVRCDVLTWTDQVRLFKTALAKSPSKTIDIVVANAGVGGKDEMVEDKLTEDGEPAEPNLAIVTVDLIGATYTTKLAMHYLPLQPEGRDRSLILVSSIAGYVEKQGSPQYHAAKFGVRGLFRNLRWTVPKQGMRVNLLAPWFIRAQINTAEWYQRMEDIGVGLADINDAAAAMMHLSSDTSLNGRAVCVLPKLWGGPGYRDLQNDDHVPEDPVTRWQELVNMM